MENKMTPELIEKARQAESPEELLALAKENGITLTEDEAREYFSELHKQSQKNGELSDDELDNVSGGGCYYKDGRLVVTALYSCRHYTCRCGSTLTTIDLNRHNCHGSCDDCRYKVNKGLRMLCNHPDNYKK
ncbi:MAG: Nif11-like leader peptide family RiPP precursor [Oscillospiraceae bacterium]|nr:Nif11-like leader peptide family RiPP precursor [Oscillospiraceae bacterium]